MGNDPSSQKDPEGFVQVKAPTADPVSPLHPILEALYANKVYAPLVPIPGTPGGPYKYEKELVTLSAEPVQALADAIHTPLHNMALHNLRTQAPILRAMSQADRLAAQLLPILQVKVRERRALLEELRHLPELHARLEKTVMNLQKALISADSLRDFLPGHTPSFESYLTERLRAKQSGSGGRERTSSRLAHPRAFFTRLATPARTSAASQRKQEEGEVKATPVTHRTSQNTLDTTERPVVSNELAPSLRVGPSPWPSPGLRFPREEVLSPPLSQQRKQSDWNETDV